jgi:transcriptional regulator with XRE-family HTH domain
MSKQRGQLPEQRRTKTVGGQKLRELRETARKSFLELASTIQVDLGEQIDAAHINKVETGRIRKPEARTVTIILDALEANYRDRRDVFEAFGYTLPMTLPTPKEIDEARGLSAHELNDSTYPVYLIDLGQRVWAWNRYLPRVLGLQPDDPAMQRFLGITLFDIAFNPAAGTRLLLDNPEEYLPAMLDFIKASIYPFHKEPWYQELIGRARTFPGFSQIWDSIPSDPFQRYPPRSIIPLHIKVGSEVLRFRGSSTDFHLDPRFRIVHLTPYGEKTLLAVARWAKEEGVD